MKHKASIFCLKCLLQIPRQSIKADGTDGSPLVTCNQTTRMNLLLNPWGDNGPD